MERRKPLRVRLGGQSRGGQASVWQRWELHGKRDVQSVG